ncbi:hypothetical protein B0H17DRAFT_1135208 [Mycena rosella]|uniref:C2H2-type domain-containing protein n=1 Tax=Mycena rosella TaxID=1033263 RepID=A0AAD7DE72_MYCRO|nr:hypothetical protein B0H17DRAFT_1135208 [Mycena rosella]
MSRSPPANDSSADPKRRYVCPDCDKAFTTSSHLGRHSRVHTGEKNYKCTFPGCETRCSRADNLQAHYRIHLAQARPKGTKKSGAGRPTSPVASSSSSSPTRHRASPPEMFRAPASRFSSVSAGNSPRPAMSPSLSPQGPPLPLYDDGFVDRFNTFASIQQSPAAVSGSRQPYPRLPGGLPPPIVHGSPDELERFHFGSPMLLQNAAPLQRRGSVPYPSHGHPPVPSRGLPTYPHATYQQPHMYQQPTNACPPRATPSPTPSDFFGLDQLPRY